MARGKADDGAVTLAKVYGVIEAVENPCTRYVAKGGHFFLHCRSFVFLNMS